MKTTSTMSGSTRSSAESIEYLLDLLRVADESKVLLRRLIEQYGAQREADGANMGHAMAEQEQRDRDFQRATINERRNRELLCDVTQVIADYLALPRNFDDVPF